MKNWIYSIVLTAALWLPAKAQHDRSQIESVRIAFITQRLDLTSEESQKFWPVYNSYHQELQGLMTEKHKQRKALKQQSGAVPVDELELESQALEIRKHYRQEFSKVLPAKKAALVYPAEREFREQLINHLKERKQKN